MKLPKTPRSEIPSWKIELMEMVFQLVQPPMEHWPVSYVEFTRDLARLISGTFTREGVAGSHISLFMPGWNENTVTTYWGGVGQVIECREISLSPEALFLVLERKAAELLETYTERLAAEEPPKNGYSWPFFASGTINRLKYIRQYHICIHQTQEQPVHFGGGYEEPPFTYVTCKACGLNLYDHGEQEPQDEEDTSPKEGSIQIVAAERPGAEDQLDQVLSALRRIDEQIPAEAKLSGSPNLTDQMAHLLLKYNELAGRLNSKSHDLFYALKSADKAKERATKAENALDDLQHDVGVFAFCGTYMDKDDKESLRSNDTIPLLETMEQIKDKRIEMENLLDQIAQEVVHKKTNRYGRWAHVQIGGEYFNFNLDDKEVVWPKSPIMEALRQVWHWKHPKEDKS